MARQTKNRHSEYHSAMNPLRVPSVNMDTLVEPWFVPLIGQAEELFGERVFTDLADHPRCKKYFTNLSLVSKWFMNLVSACRPTLVLKPSQLEDFFASKPNSLRHPRYLCLDCPYSKEVLNLCGLRDLPNLTFLELRRATLRWDQKVCFRYLTNLRRLFFHNCQFLGKMDDSNLAKPLVALRSLQNLRVELPELWQPKKYDIIVDLTTKLTHLSSLTFETVSPSLSNKLAKSLVTFTNLTELDFNGIPTARDYFTSVWDLTSLRKLRFWIPISANRDHMLGITKLTNLTDLRCDTRTENSFGSKIHENAIHFVSELTNLQVLCVRDVQADFGWVSSMTNLTKLELPSLKKTDNFPDIPEKLTKIRSLSIPWCREDLTFIDFLSRFTNLTRLKLWSCPRFIHEKNNFPSNYSKLNNLQKLRKLTVESTEGFYFGDIWDSLKLWEWENSCEISDLISKSLFFLPYNQTSDENCRNIFIRIFSNIFSPYLEVLSFEDSEFFTTQKGDSEKNPTQKRDSENHVAPSETQKFRSRDLGIYPLVSRLDSLRLLFCVSADCVLIRKLFPRLRLRFKELESRK